MNGHNAFFIENPFGYLNLVPVNNILFFQNFTLGIQQRVTALNTIKQGHFDLERQGDYNQVIFKIVGNNVRGEVPIHAYWCPYISGDVNEVGIGFVNIPRTNPEIKFVFTAPMNGCALIATDLSMSGMIRIYHHQHPPEGIREYPRFKGHEILSCVSFADYGDKTQPNAFVCLAYLRGKWQYIIQPQITLRPHVMNTTTRVNVIIRDPVRKIRV